MARKTKYRKLRRTTFAVPIQFMKDFKPTDFSAFCFWLTIKSTYSRNSVAYNTSIHQLSKRYKNSHYLTSKLVNRIIENEWGYWTSNGHLQLYGFRRVCGIDMKLGHVDIKLKPYYKLKDVKENLRAALLLGDVDQQEFMYKFSNGLLTELPWKILKEKLKKYKETEICEPRAITSDRRIARKTLTSVSSANRLKHRLVKRGIINIETIEQRLKYLGNKDFKPFYQEGVGLYKKNKGYLVLIKGTYITSNS